MLIPTAGGCAGVYCISVKIWTKSVSQKNHNRNTTFAWSVVVYFSGAIYDAW
jgi:hypothetical protein